MKKGRKKLLWSVPCCLLLILGLWLGWTWYDNNVDRSGWREKNGVTMYADFHGKPVTGWLDIDGSRYYFGEDHALQTGWLTMDGITWYLDPDGKMQKHWLETEAGSYYFGSDGILRTGWQEIGDDRCYFDENGLLQRGWVELEGIPHYFREDGTLASGWQDIGGDTYYLDQNGTPKTGWTELEGQTYLFYDSGVLHTGWITLEEGTYLFGEDGVMCTGWQDTDSGRFYFADNGTMATGWTEIEGSRYFFTETGSLHTGWLEQGEYRYYLLPDGTAATGRQEIDGKTCYFSPKGIWVLLVNPWNPISADYAPELVEAEQGFYVDKSCLEALNAMLEAMRAEGLLPYFTSTYRSEGQQRGIWADYVARYMAQGYDETTANAMTADYVAVPGTSEHHTGLALDIVGYDYYYNGNPGSTKAVQDWLKAHCWEYGFILRYTAEKRPITGFAAETWHFRYVGTEVSMDMKDTGLCLEEYLGAYEAE